jgi:hypothetical protein
MEDNKELYSSMPLLLYYEDIDEDTDDVIERYYPTDTAQIKLVSYQYSADRMGGAPVITASFYNDGCIDSDMWSKRVYTKFRRERYYLKNIPSSTKDNTNALTKHDVTFISERFVLDNILFYDIVDKDASDGKYVSNSTTFNFFGSIEELAARLNAAFAYANVDYVIEIDKNLPKIEDKLVTADNAYLSSIIQEFYNTFEIPYYFVGKTIHVGYYEDTIGIDDKNKVFEYGASNALLSITKTTSDTKVITRCTGIGSEDNIHYFYPNPTELGTVHFDDENVEIVDVSRFNSLESGDTFSYIIQNKDIKTPVRINRSVGNSDVSEVTFTGSDDVVSIYINNLQEKNTFFSFKLERVEITDSDVIVHTVDNIQNVDKNGLILRAKLLYNEIYILYILSNKKMKLTESDEERGEVYIKTMDSSNNIVVSLCYESSNKVDGWYHYRQGFDEPRYCQLSHYGLRYNGDIPEYGDAGKHIEFKLFVDKVLPFQTNLMPPIFRASDAKERFYNAEDGKYKKEDGTTYIFDTPYNDYNRKEHLEKFEDIKPTIVGMTNKDGQPIDEFQEFAYDDDDNDKLVAGTEDYEHPYFYAKLRKLDGPFGFNLFDQASEKGEMTISMTSGNCGACNFVVMVDDSKRNPVQVNDDGTLKKDAKGNVIVVGTPQDRQNDTRTNEVWVALKKDTGTYGVIMPNATHDYKPKVEDKFVIVNIALPQAYIEHAEKKLEDEIIKFMWENNGQAFDFSIKFSRIYLAENTALLKTLTENAMIKIGYPNKDTVWDLYVSNFVYKVDANSPLPEITLSVTKKLGAGSNSIQTAISKIERNITERLNAMPTNEQNRALYMSKDGSETVDGAKTFSKKVTFENGAEFGEYTSGEQGASIHKDDQGQWVQEIDYLNVRKKLTYAQIEVLHAQHLGGAQITSAASCYIDLVENKYDESGKLICYRCYFKKVGDEGIVIKNLWEFGDQAYSEKFDSYKVTSSDNTGRMAWWRKVILTSNDIDNIGDSYVTDGEETINAQDYHFIDVSALNDSENCADGLYEYTPSKGDSVILLGNRNPKADPSRTNAIVQSSSGDGSPYYKQFKGIVDFVLPEPQTLLSPEKNVLSGIVNIQNGSNGAQYLTDLPETVLGTVKVGGENLLLNTSFKGDYMGSELYNYHQMDKAQQMFSDNFVNWDGKVLEIEVDESITTNNICSFFELSQDVTLVANETYTLTFKILGLINVQYGASKEIGTQIGKGRMWSNEKITFVGTGLLEKLSFVSVRANSFICDIKLEKGNIPTDWTPSSKDENAAYEEIYANKYINRAIREGKTSILGGLILTSLINLGKYEDGNLTEITSGISGIYNDDHDVAFWGGGDLRKAIKSVQMYRNNPKFVPTEDELAEMAKTVITHGGRAILNDVIARGTIYAEDGVFRGSVRGKEGIFKGGIRGEMVEITQYNFKDYLYEKFLNRIDFDKAGYNIRFVGEFTSPHITIALPSLGEVVNGRKLTKEEKDEVRCSTGNRILIYNETKGGFNDFIPIYLMYETFENGHITSKTDIIEYANLISIQGSVAAVNGEEYISYDIKTAFINNL